jgi:hypothetical protein
LAREGQTIHGLATRTQDFIRTAQGKRET